MWQQLLDLTGLVRGQAREDIPEVGVRIMPVHAR